MPKIADCFLLENLYSVLLITPHYFTTLVFMLLDTQYTYLFLDFETTGLDPNRDEPIQIWLVQINPAGQVLSTFSSHLKPNKPIQELKTIVNYLTNKDLADLDDAPSIHDILPQIAPFFTENTVLIGHNIGFDLQILRNYHNREPLLTIDTFPLAKVFFHFLPSYALEVVARHLPWKPVYQAHDALADCQINKEVFLYCVEQAHMLRKEYLILDYSIQKAVSPFAQILQRSAKQFTYDQQTLFLPPLTRPIKPSKKVVRSPQAITLTAETVAQKTIYVGNSSLATLLQSIKRTWSARVLIFSHKSKAQLAMYILEEQGITITELHDGHIFIPEAINTLLHLPEFDEGELFFLLKYFSQYHQRHTIMDINSSDDYKIFWALTKPKPIAPGSIMVGTHHQWYTRGQDVRFTAETTVLFFDHDRWWYSWKQHLQETFDPYHLLQHLEHLHYKAHLYGAIAEEQIIHTMLIQCTIFFGVRWGEINHLFAGHQHQEWEVESTIGHPRFPHTTQLFHKLSTTMNEWLLALPEGYAHTIEPKRDHLMRMLRGTTCIRKTMYAGDKWYYTFQEPAVYHDYQEFLDALPPFPTTKLSTLASQHIAPLPNNTPPFRIREPRGNDQLLQRLLEQTTHTYILTTSKSSAQQLFQFLHQQKITTTFLVLAENVTGGVWKITYLASVSKKPVILIGGYACFLQARTKKFAISLLIPYYCDGKQKELLLADCQFYG